MAGRCKDCEHWKGRGFSPKYGDCLHSKFIYSGGDGAGTEYPPDGLTYWDYESYKAGFLTGKDFGCVHFVRSEAVAEDDGAEWTHFPEPMETVFRCPGHGYCPEHGPDNPPSRSHLHVFRHDWCDHCGEMYDLTRGCACLESQVCPFAEEPG